MDNLTHALTGILIAEAAVQIRAARGSVDTRSFVRSAYVVSAVANNLPDLDFLYSRITEPRKLGYLVHHRGHTHTLLGALILALLWLGLFRLLSRSSRAFARKDWAWLTGLALGGGLTHIAMDFSNNYGVHPFWPVYGGWFYGDFIFIVEPWFFLIGLSVLIFTFEARVARWVAAILLVAGYLLLWRVPFVPWTVALFGSLVAAGSLSAAWLLRPARRIAFGIGASLAVAVTFAISHGRARNALVESLPNGATLADVVLTPSPGNPLCFSAWRVSSAGDRYLAERGVVAPWPALSSVHNCRTESDDDETTAPLDTVDRFEGETVHFTGTYRASLGDFAALARSDCTFKAFLRYARVPFWIEAERKTTMGDLRYDRNPRLEFAELEASSTAPCPHWVPGWTPPRAGLLR